MAFKFSAGSQHDSQSAASLLKHLEGLAFGDKGYLSKKLFDALLADGLKLITRKRKNMAAPILSAYEKQLLNQRNLIETVIDKSIIIRSGTLDIAL